MIRVLHTPGAVQSYREEAGGRFQMWQLMSVIPAVGRLRHGSGLLHREPNIGRWLFITGILESATSYLREYTIQKTPSLY